MGDPIHRPPMRRGTATSAQYNTREEEKPVIHPDYQCPYCKARAPKSIKKCPECEKDIPGR